MSVRLPSRQPQQQPPTVLIGLMAIGACSLAFIGMAAVVMPQFLLMVLVGIGMVLFFAAQYFIWGRWLYPLVVRQEQQREQRLQEAAAATVAENAGKHKEIADGRSEPRTHT